MFEFAKVVKNQTKKPKILPHLKKNADFLPFVHKKRPFVHK